MSASVAQPFEAVRSSLGVAPDREDLEDGLNTCQPPPQSMGFTLVGALFIIPFILVYTAWSYYVFRGKVKAGEGYH